MQTPMIISSSVLFPHPIPAPRSYRSCSRSLRRPLSTAASHSTPSPPASCLPRLDYVSYERAKAWEQQEPLIRIFPEFVTQEESDALVAELDPQLHKRKYETSHWDSVIQGYREIEVPRLTSRNFKVIKRVLGMFEPRLREAVQPMHVLDLAEDGFIKPHVDNVKFSGDLLAALCLLSPAVMELTHEETKSAVVSAFLPTRCLYIMSKTCRYQFAHAVLPGDFTWAGQSYRRGRRLSLMFRDSLPHSEGGSYSAAAAK